MIFIEYLFVVLGDLYFSMGDVTFNYDSVTSLITARVTLVMLVFLALFIVIFVEIYFKCSNLNYQIKVIKEEHLYRLELVAKDTTE